MLTLSHTDVKYVIKFEENETYLVKRPSLVSHCYEVFNIDDAVPETLCHCIMKAADCQPVNEASHFDRQPPQLVQATEKEDANVNVGEGSSHVNIGGFDDEATVATVATIA